VLAIRIQREVGGNLAELLQTVGGDHGRAGPDGRRGQALTAEGRIRESSWACSRSAWGCSCFTAAPDYIHALFASAMGWAMVVGSALMGLAGFAWIQKIIKIEV